MAKAQFGDNLSYGDQQLSPENNPRLRRIPVGELRLNMQVVELDRPWLDTPFLMQGFVLQQPEEITILQELCHYVYIDVGYYQLSDVEKSRGVQAFTQKPVKAEFEEFGLSDYRDESSIQEEIITVESVYKDYELMVGTLYDDLQFGKEINMTKVKHAVTGIVESIKRNPDACMLLHELRKKHDYAYNHAMGCSIWAASLGRHLGLPKAELEKLALGGLMLDVGKIEISDRILKKQGKLSPSEFGIVKSHVDASLRLVSAEDPLEESVLEMIAFHHERFDGHGYPQGLTGVDIPVYARIAAIVDCYDALISERPYATAMPPSDAIRKLYHMRKSSFQPELVEEFIQAVGVYPPGTMLELTNGEVAVVITECRNRRLRPKVLMLLDENKQPYQDTLYLNLMTVREDKDGNPLEILRSLEPGSYGIDLEGLLFPSR